MKEEEKGGRDGRGGRRGRGRGGGNTNTHIPVSTLDDVESIDDLFIFFFLSDLALFSAESFCRSARLVGTTPGDC